jgi:hypothetical protein
MMKSSVSKEIVRFFRFMRLFRVTLFSLLDVKPQRIRAIIAWKDDCAGGLPDREDTQEVVWECKSEEDIDDGLDVGEYAYDAGLIKSDHITVNVDDIQRQFGWETARSEAALRTLLQVRARMIDNGKEADEFLLHQ